MALSESQGADAAAALERAQQRPPRRTRNAPAASRLRDAIIRDDIEELTRLLDQGASVDAPIDDANCSLPVHLASQLGHLDALKQVVHRGARIHGVYTADGESPLTLAAAHDHLATVKWLVEHADAVVNDAANWDHSPLARAVQCDNARITQYLLAHGAATSSELYPSLSVWATAVADEKLDILACLVHNRRQELVDDSKLRVRLLEIAVRRPSIAVARALLSARAFTCSELTNALCIATMQQRPAFMELLVASGADVNGANPSGLTPMFFAIEHSTPGATPNTTETLLALGADLSVPPMGTEYPVIHSMAISERVDLLQLMLEIRGDTAAFRAPSRSDRHTPLHAAARHGDLATVRFFVETLAPDGLNLEVTNRFGETPLMLAAQNGHVHVVRYLLGLGAAMVSNDPSARSTALFGAAANGHFDVVQCLCERGADVNWQRNDSATALNVATEREHIEVVASLVETWGADVTAMDYGLTALDEAVLQGDVALVRVLLANNAQACCNLAQRSNVLCEAVLARSVPIAQLLVAFGADVNAPYTVALEPELVVLTPLLLAACRGDLAMVKYLCASGADVESASNEGETALLAAVIWGRLDVVQFLADDMNANVLATTAYGCSPVDASVFGAYHAITAHLRRYSHHHSVVLASGSQVSRHKWYSETAHDDPVLDRLRERWDEMAHFVRFRSFYCARQANLLLETASVLYASR